MKKSSHQITYLLTYLCIGNGHWLDEEVVASNYLLTYLCIGNEHWLDEEIVICNSETSQECCPGKDKDKIRKTRQIIAATNTISISQHGRRRLNRHQHHIHHILRSYSLVCFKGVGRNDLRWEWCRSRHCRNFRNRLWARFPPWISANAKQK